MGDDRGENQAYDLAWARRAGAVMVLGSLAASNKAMKQTSACPIFARAPGAGGALALAAYRQCYPGSCVTMEASGTVDRLGRQAIAFLLAFGSACTPFLPSDKAGLMEAMGSNDMAVNFSAARKFGRLFGVPGLLEAMEHPTANTRAVAAHFLMDHPGPEVEAALIKGAEDTDEYVRMWCAFSLGKVGTGNARPVLERLAQDKSQIVSRQAAESLEELQDRLRGKRDGAG